jgi:hypothetical protein
LNGHTWAGTLEPRRKSKILSVGKWDNVGMLYRENGDANALDTLRGEVIAHLPRLQ